MKLISGRSCHYLLFALLIIALIFGCGSGNGGETTTPSDPPSVQPVADNYYPNWAVIAPTNTISLNYNAGRTAEEIGNGAA